MPRILLLIVLFWLLYQVVKRLVASSQSPAPSKKTNEAEKIVKCSQCGLHVPESESLMNNGLTVCNNPQCSNVPSAKN